MKSEEALHNTNRRHGQRTTECNGCEGVVYGRGDMTKIFHGKNFDVYSEQSELLTYFQ
jgi:hypothetical protein